MSRAYRLFAYLGLATLFGTLLFGFRHAPGAPAENVLFDLVLYGAFGGVHLVMTRGWFKRAVWGDPAGSPVERRVYVVVTVVTWIAVVLLHRPLPGPVWDLPEWARYVGNLGFVLAIVAFFDGANFAMIDGLLGVPGSAMSHTHGAETPLFTEGAYASVRHPMYRAATLACACAVLIHPNAATIFWSVLVAATFIGFIPIEERQLIAARGDAYRRYREQTPYRLIRGVW